MNRATVDAIDASKRQPVNAIARVRSALPAQEAQAAAHAALFVVGLTWDPAAVDSRSG